MQPLSLVQAAFLLPTFKFLTKHGAPIERRISACGLSDFNFYDPKAYVPAFAAIRFLEDVAAIDLSDNPVQDLESAYRLENMAHYGRAILSAPNMLAAGAVASDPGNAIVSYNNVALRIDGPVATVSDGYCYGKDPGQLIIEGLSLLLLLDALVQFGGPYCRPLVLGHTGRDFPRHTVPIDLSKTRIRSEQPENYASFPSSWLVRAPCGPARETADDNWAPGDTVSMRLLEIFRSLEWEARPTLKRIANLAGMSTRTLQRHLADEGTSFFELLDTWRLNIALRAIELPEKSLNEVAQEAGYQDPAHFNRAFRRWTGKSPSAYREELASL